MVYDGKTLTVLGKNANAVAKAEEPGTIDQLVDVLRKKVRQARTGRRFAHVGSL